MPNAEHEHPIVGIVRVSTMEQAADDKGGIPRQLAAIEQARKAHNLNIVRTVVVKESGRHVSEDPEFKRIFRELREGTLKGAVVAEQSRLIRPDDLGDLALFDHFRRNKALIYTPSARIDSNTTEGYMTLGMTAIMSAIELHLIKSRMVGARQELRDEGFSAGGRLTIPRGVTYTKHPKGQRGGVWGHDEFAQKIRECYRMLFRGAGYQEMADYCGLTINGVKATLANPIWYGVRVFNKKSTGPERLVKSGPRAGSRYRLKEKVDPLPVPINIPVLLTKAEWDRAQSLMEQRKGAARARRKPARVSVPAALLHCDLCNLPFYVQLYSKQSLWDRYHCASHDGNRRRASRQRAELKKCDTPVVKRVVLERTLEQAMDRFMTVPVLRDMLNHSQERDPAPGIKNADQKLAQLRLKLDRINDAYFEMGKLDKPEWMRRSDKLKREMKLIEADRPIESPRFNARASALNLAKPFVEFPLLQVSEKRGLLIRAIERILVNGEGITGLRFKGGFLAQNTVSESGSHSYTDFDFRHFKIIELKFAEIVPWAAAA